MKRAALPLAAIAFTLMGAKADPLAGRVAGKPVDCVDVDQAGGPDIVDSSTILYRQSGKRIWKTGPVDACPALRPLDALIVELYGKRLCKGDRFRVLNAGMSIPSGYCRFTAFTPYDKP